MGELYLEYKETNEIPSIGETSTQEHIFIVFSKVYYT